MRDDACGQAGLSKDEGLQGGPGLTSLAQGADTGYGRNDLVHMLLGLTGLRSALILAAVFTASVVVGVAWRNAPPRTTRTTDERLVPIVINDPTRSSTLNLSCPVYNSGDEDLQVISTYDSGAFNVKVFTIPARTTRWLRVSLDLLPDAGSNLPPMRAPLEDARCAAQAPVTRSYVVGNVVIRGGTEAKTPP